MAVENNPFVAELKRLGVPGVMGYVAYHPGNQRMRMSGVARLTFATQIDGHLALWLRSSNSFDGSYSDPSRPSGSYADIELYHASFFGVENDDEKGRVEAKRRLYEKAIEFIIDQEFDDLTDYAIRTEQQIC